MNMSWPTNIPSSDFKNLIFGKYNFTFDNFYGYMDSASMSIQGLKLDFAYSMLFDPNIDDMAGSYKLRFEIEDQDISKATYFKDFELNAAGQVEEFKEGQSIKKTITFSDPNILEKVQSFSKYKISVYYLVNDQKVLIAQATIPYFTIQTMQ
jgi:hypothetical protein